MELVGYCSIKKNATTCAGTDAPEKFLGRNLRVMEFAQDGGVLCVAQDGSCAAMFDKKDVYRKFKCDDVSGVLIPPNLNMIELLLPTFDTLLNLSIQILFLFWDYHFPIHHFPIY